MKKVKITVMRRGCYSDLIERFENPLENPCQMREGDSWISVDAQKPEGFCGNAWETLAPFVKTLSEGGGNFYDGWMKDPRSALLSCNDGFRPVSFYLEVMEATE